jgi:small subunit ribosomal protein S18
VSESTQDVEQQAPAPSGPSNEGGAPERGERREREERPRRRGGGGGRFGRRRVCAFCVDKVDHIDYKEPAKLRRYVSDRAKIEPRRKTGTCAKHQRMLTLALKRARHIALLPYTAMHIQMTGVFPSRS